MMSVTVTNIVGARAWSASLMVVLMGLPRSSDSANATKHPRWARAGVVGYEKDR